MTGPSRDIEILPATPADVPLILALIRELAEFVGLLSEVQATEESLRETLFGAHPCAEVLLARSDDEVAGFALYFQNYSTFLAKPGLYLEISMCVRRSAGVAWAARCYDTWRASPSNAAAAGSSGPCSPGTGGPSTSTMAWVHGSRRTRVSSA